MGCKKPPEVWASRSHLELEVVEEYETVVEDAGVDSDPRGASVSGDPFQATTGNSVAVPPTVVPTCDQSHLWTTCRCLAFGWAPQPQSC